MADTINNCEPAFPNEGFNGWGTPQQGMTLRDYFAAKALQSLISRIPYGNGHAVNAEAVSVAAYQWADAMLKERSQ